MAVFQIPIPLRGVNKGLAVEDSPPGSSGDMNNVRPRDVLENRIRIGQRPGKKKAYTTQVGNINNPVVEIIEVTWVV